MQSTKSYKLLIMAQGNNENDKENTDFNIQTEVSKPGPSKIIPQTLKATLGEDEIFQYPVSYEDMTNVTMTINECANSRNVVKDMDLEDLKAKLLYQTERPEKRHFSLDDIEDSDDSVMDKDYVPPHVPLQDNDDELTSLNIEPLPSTSQHDVQLTKSGKIRQRKKFDSTTAERKEEKQKMRKTKHKVIDAGEDCCRKLCNNVISETLRNEINEKFWEMSWREQKIFVTERISCTTPMRRKKVDLAANYKRNKTLQYTFLQDGENKIVCKKFFLNTLGFRRDNHSVIGMAMKMKIQSTLMSDKRGTNPKKKIERNIIQQHIESYNPAISHYRREHAPKRRYLPPELTIQKMYDEFCELHGKVCSYDTYRETVNSMNISFAKLGHEECERCEAFKIHNKDHLLLRHFKCDMCKIHDQHVEKASAARNAYKTTKIDNDDTVCYSADLQKVLMLPRMETLKSVLFCPRIIAFNESFVPVGKSNDPPLAILWHEAISGRKKEDLLSTFRMFLLEVRDSKKVILWLDNCAGQNKNWSLFSFLVYFINSGEVGIESIVLHYFEPGHTFMSADSFHHQVELSMKRVGKLYDFKDFKAAVEKSNNGKVKVEDMKVIDFFSFEDCSAARKISTTKPRPYLSDMVQVKFSIGELSLEYKNSHESENFIRLDFLKTSILKHGFPSDMLKFKKQPRGITSKRKLDIIQRLSKMMPSNRIKFWEDLPVNDAAVDLISEYDNE